MPDWQAWKSLAQQGLQQAKEQAGRTAAVAQERLRRGQVVQRRQSQLNHLGELVLALSPSVREGLGTEIVNVCQAIAALDEEIAVIDRRIATIEKEGEPHQSSSGPVCPACGARLPGVVKFCPECGSAC